MRKLGMVAGGVALAGATAALVGAGLRVRQERAVDAEWRELWVGAEGTGAHPPSGAVARFDPGSLEGLPAPARRYLRHSIAAGTPLARAVELEMGGEIQTRPGADPLPMRALEVIASGRGLIWRARVGDGLVRMRGYDRFVDGTGEMRWWVWGAAPVVRSSGPDFDRSAAGRLAGEAVFLPSLLLPEAGARWEAVDDSTARVHLPWTGSAEPVEITVDPDGRLLRAALRRWNGDPANGPVGYLPFGVETLGPERTFGGYTIPTAMRGGWRIGEPGAFLFFRPIIRNGEYR